MRLLLLAWTLAAAAVAPGAAASDRAPPPGFPAPGPEVAEGRIDELPAGDVRRAELLLDLALRRHAEAEALADEERSAHASALARWRAAPSGGAPPRATPRADGRRAEAARLAQRALEEGGPGFGGAPEALLVIGLDLDRVGRSREALRALAAVVRRHGEHRSPPTPGSRSASTTWRSAISRARGPPTSGRAPAAPRCAPGPARGSPRSRSASGTRLGRWTRRKRRSPAAPRGP
jgi:hypothetical protein